MTVQVGAGNHYSIFFKDGVVYSVGENSESQLARGLGTEAGVAEIAPIALPEGFDKEIVAISAGQLHGAFLTADGEVYAWGDNNFGKLGQGSTANYESLVPTKVAGLDGIEIASIHMTNGASYAISADGALYAWGQNTNGQLGIGGLVNQGSVVAVPSSAFGGEVVTALSSGSSHTLVLTESGEVYAMGSNVQKQLGPNGVIDGATLRRSDVPLLVDIEGTVTKIIAGTNTSIAITTDGKVWGWGQSDFGQLVKGTIVDGILTAPDTASAATPTEIQGLPDDVVDAHIGSRWGIALTSDGEVWAWGRNDEGWLGLETATGELSTLIAPTKIPGFDGINIVSIDGGPNHSLAVDDEGNVYGWGNMNQGRLGTEQAAGTWASGPVLIPLEGDGRTVVVGGSSDETLGGDVPADGQTGFSLYGFGGSDKIAGSTGSDYINGGTGNDSLDGNAGDDILIGGRGNDDVDGGSGSDTAKFSGLATDYSVTFDAITGELVVRDLRSEATDGEDRLTDIEYLAFNDQTVAAETFIPDQNNAPDTIRLSRQSVSEDIAKGTSLGLFSAVDLDGDTLTYKLVDNADGHFRLYGNKLVTAGSFDFETASEHTITVAVFDGTTTVEKDFTIVVNDVLEPQINLAPESLSFSRSSVRENVSIGTSVGLFSAIDPEGGSLKWRLADDADASFRLVGNKLVTAAPIDFETTPSLEITVEVIDAAGNVTSQEVTLAVTDVFEPVASAFGGVYSGIDLV